MSDKCVVDNFCCHFSLSRCLLHPFRPSFLISKESVLISRSTFGAAMY